MSDPREMVVAAILAETFDGILGRPGTLEAVHYVSMARRLLAAADRVVPPESVRPG